MPEESLERVEFAELSAELLRRGNKVRFRARGRSMAPLIRDGDVLTVEPAGPETLRVGDVALHRIGGEQVVAHRVLARRAERGEVLLTTRGDALSGPHDRVCAEEVLGRVVEVERDGRVLRLDRGPWRVLGLVAAKLLPLRALVARLVKAARRCASRLLRQTQAEENGAPPSPRRTGDRDSVKAPPASRPRDEMSDALISLCGAFTSGSEWSVPADLSCGNWKRLVDLAKRHGLTPLLYRSVSDLGDCRIPTELCASLRKHYVVQIARNVRALQQLEEIAEALRDRGIRLIVLKGAAALLWLYKDIACRTMADLDLMVREESAAELDMTMKDLGYFREASNGPPEIALINMRQGYRYPFCKQGLLPADIHTNILDSRGPWESAVREMWAKARPDGPAGALCSLDPSHFLLYSGRHYMKHVELSHGPLRSMVDMILAVRKWGGEIDWAELWRTAKRWRIGRDLGVVMATLNHYWDLRIPLIPPGATPLSARALVYGIPGAGDRLVAAFASACLDRLLGLTELPDTSSRLRYLRFWFFPPPENLRCFYGIPQGRAVAPYYVRHLVTLAGRLARGLLAWARLHLSMPSGQR